MSKSSKPRRKTRVELEAENKALHANMIIVLTHAHEQLKKTGCDRYLGSGLVVTITNLSGKEVVEPFMCSDGLEQATIDALQAQIKKSQALAMMHALKG